MPFEFPLAALLRYRKSLEQQEYLLFEKVQQEVAQVEVKLRQIEEACASAAHTRTIELAKGARAVEVQSAYEYERALAQQREALQALWQELKKKWRQQLTRYEQARRNRETLEELRAKKLQAYQREQAKREQATIDDIFLSRHRSSRQARGH